ncbi:MAG: P1 family peptidase [Clostridia bacterium]
MTKHRRGREWGLPFAGEPGPFNAITDVPGVQVGLTTIREPDVATGVTAVLPIGRQHPLRPVWAGMCRFNGNGEMTGTHWIKDAGYFLGPLMITNTHSVGMVHHATLAWMIRQYPAQFDSPRHLWAMPVVAETYDGALSDINGLHVREEHVWHALDSAAGGVVAEGGVGGGTGMIAYGFKGGTGTSSRQVTAGGRAGVVAALVQANHGARSSLTILGVPVGEVWDEDGTPPERGSLIVYIGTDLPLLPHQLDRVARRAAVGMARTGAFGGHHSGDLFLAFSVANPIPLPHDQPSVLALEALSDEHLDPVYVAAVQAVEEAIINAMLAGEPMVTRRPPGHVIPALDGGRLVSIMRAYGRMQDG